MYRSEGLGVFVKYRGEALVVLGVGYVGRELYALDHQDTNLYNVEMPYPSPLGLGLALALPDTQVVVLDGDGSLISGLGVLTTIGNEAPNNLTVVVWDNEAYVSSGGISSPSAGNTDIAGIARAAGIERSTTTRTLEEFERSVSEALSSEGPAIIVAKVAQSPRQEVSPYPFNLTENAIRFRRALVDRGLVDPWVAGVSWSLSFDHHLTT